MGRFGEKDKMKKTSFGKRFRYWLERNMAKGTPSMIKLLLAVVLFMAALVTVLVLLFHEREEGTSVLALFWDNLRAAMSSGFPAAGSGSLLHIILYTLLGLTGMIFTGMLISIFSTAMRGKILALQTENPEILEEGHVVVLGFRTGEYALLGQLMTAAGGKKRTIVVADKMERVDMEQAIRTNLEVPRNIRLVAINANTESAAELECCAIGEASRVIIYTRDAGRTVKTYLAVNALLKGAARRPKITTSGMGGRGGSASGSGLVSSSGLTTFASPWFSSKTMRRSPFLISASGAGFSRTRPSRYRPTTMPLTVARTAFQKGRPWSFGISSR